MRLTVPYPQGTKKISFPTHLLTLRPKKKNVTKEESESETSPENKDKPKIVLVLKLMDHQLISII